MTRLCRTNPPQDLSPRQRLAAKALTEGASVSAVAKRLGVERRTVGRWKKLPKFVAEIDRHVEPAPGAVAEHVNVSRVQPPRRRARESAAEMLAKLAAQPRKQFVWEGVQYPDYKSYNAAIAKRFPSMAGFLQSLTE